jgi:hypothetical protein
MKKKEIFKCTAFCLAFLFIVVPGICSGSSMGDFDADVAIGTTPRHEWMPNMAYNPIDNDFVVLWHTSGTIEAGGEEMFSLDGQRVSPEGALLGAPISLVAPFGGYCSLPRPVHNVFRNEYMVIFSWGEQYTGRDTYIARMDNMGNLLSGPTVLFPSETNANHQTLLFNPQEKEYLVAFNDYTYGDSANFGVIVDEDGNELSDLFLIGVKEGIKFNPQGAYNPNNSTYLFTWEDFRHYPTWSEPSDIYGVLLDTDGNRLTEEDIHIVGDTGIAEEGDQRVQRPAYNPDRDETLVIWADSKRPDLDGGGLVGRIIGSDGIPKGPDFVIADAPGSQSSPEIVYVEDRQEYFVVWNDCRNCTPGLSRYASDNLDIYGTWLSASGQPIGENIPICTEEGNQGYSVVVYNPVMQRLLIAWREQNVDEPVEPPDPGAPGHLRPSPGDVMGKIIGMPSFCSGRVVEAASGNPVEDARVIIMGLGLPTMKTTNAGGWFNVVEEQQRRGTYLLIAFARGYKMTMELMSYEDEPMTTTIELR